MKNIIKVINRDLIQIGDKYVYSNESYNWGRTYYFITNKEAERIINEANDLCNVQYDVAELENKKGYVISSYNYSNVFLMKVDNHIYLCSYLNFKYKILYISVNYNIDTNKFEIDNCGDVIVSDVIEKFINEYAEKHY